MPETISVRMLGGFSIEWGNRQINDGSNRMRKIWLLLAYLIYHRNNAVTQEHFVSLLRGKNSDDPLDIANNLKAMFYRARTMLDQLDDTAGHDLIIRKEGNYAWNTEIPLHLDAEDFERLCREGAAAEGQDEILCLDLYQQALLLYDGDFLPKLSMESWVMPLAAYYHRLYLEVAEKVLSMLTVRERWHEAADLCEKVLRVEPYLESVCQHLMRCRIAMGDRSAALALYEEMSDYLFSTFGVMPSDESRAVYRDASRASDDTTIPVATIREQLREPGSIKGAMLCEYDFFKLLYQAQARSIVRSGDVIHIAVFSLRPQGRKTLSRRSLDTAMENIKIQFINHLRQGDVISQCSLSQLILMLPQANYENSCKVCERLIRAFFRQHPHAPVDIQYSVQPLEPITGAFGGDRR